MQQQHSSVLLTRILGLKDLSPFVLIQDTVVQTGKYFLLEFAHRNASKEDVKIVCLSFENVDVEWMKCSNLVFIDCNDLSQNQIHDKVNSTVENAAKSLILVDSLSDVDGANLVKFMTPLIRPNSTVVAVSHLDDDDRRLVSSYAPKSSTQLQYLATTIIKIMSKSNIDMEESDTFLLPIGSNSPSCLLEFTHRRKSGRAVEGRFDFDFNKHTVTLKPTVADKTAPDQDELVKGLTTFNIGLTDKQKIARDNVELPYLKAQQDETGGGAIVYEFEKEDDYDEEDPYEDPI
ncbi:Elongator complex protein 5 [Lipomyces arxii]|uniref:Elongator complex protein 5 n=1 Tax=Lipomyces arxii TaxID=56418 RepID=UPI0034CDFF91